MLSLLKDYCADLFDLFYPNICVCCSDKLLKGETITCIRCETELPKTNHWHNPNNELMKKFWGRVYVEGAASLYTFKKGGEVQHMLHHLKYRGRKDIGEFVGKRIGHLIMDDASCIKKPDLIVPVPLHWKKLKIRGYNQCAPLAEGISQVLNVPTSLDCLKRNHENISQTKKKRFDRWKNVSHIFSVQNQEMLIGKHVLLVDDVITTGATAEACLETILSVEGTKTSFVSIAVAAH